MPVPYESTGRRNQKARTREALVAATRALLTEGVTPTVEHAAANAGISRTTAYRYFPSQRSLLLAAYPEIAHESLLPKEAPDDPEARLDIVMQAFTAITTEWEPQLRTSLRLALEKGRDSDQPLRKGRAIGWIEDALIPLRDSHPGVDIHRLAIAIRSATGIEALVWLTDVAGLDRDEAVQIMRWTARAQLQAAMTEQA
ncbi:MAG TPA: TetR family transcriptional regulator [Micromonosporaceae bacterium]|nr:TetR family transcriptional regulator [Micromonosporaceae bacterium]HCU49203.1 TetR family transcriptional regulator [Micromonosporaceae bacterium]